MQWQLQCNLPCSCAGVWQPWSRGGTLEQNNCVHAMLYTFGILIVLLYCALKPLIVSAVISDLSPARSLQQFLF